MLRGFLSSRALFLNPENDQGSGGTPPPATPPAADPPAADPVDPPAGGQEPPADDDDDEDPPQLTAEQERAELDRARRQAAKYRTQRREAQQALETANARIRELEAAAGQPVAADPAAAAEARATAAERRAAIAEAAAGSGVPMAALQAFRALEAADGDAIGPALEALAAFLAPVSAGGQRPPDSPGATLTLDQQIADAEKRKDVKTSMRLKAQRLAQIAAQQGTR